MVESRADVPFTSSPLELDDTGCSQLQLHNGHLHDDRGKQPSTTHRRTLDRRRATALNPIVTCHVRAIAT
jgi:hypothetical protein